MRIAAPLIALVLVSFSFCQPGGNFGRLPGFENTAPLTTAEGLGIGSRFLGMGGAGVAVADDASALYWNPAGLSFGEGSELDIDASGKVNDLDVLSDLRDVVRILRRGDSQLSAADIHDIVEAAAAANGKPVEATAGAIAGLRVHNFAIGGWGRGMGGMEILWNGSTTTPEVEVGGITGGVSPGAVHTAGALPPALLAWATNLGAGWAKKWSDKVRAGLTLRQQYLGLREAFASGYIDGGTPHGGVTELFNDTVGKLTGGIGFLFTPEENIRIGVVARNLAGSTYNLSYMGMDLPIPTSRSFDIGFAAFSHDGHTIVAGDVHNLTGADGGRGTFHVGMEHHFNDWLVLRMGTATDTGFCWGFDLDLLKQALIRMASSTTLGQQIGLGMALRF